MINNPPTNAGDRIKPSDRKIPWRRKWQLTPVFFPGKSHGQRSWQAIVQGVVKESDTFDSVANTLTFAFM